MLAETLKKAMCILTLVQDEAANGRLCFPFMILHTIKNTELERTPNLPVTDSALQDDAI